MVSCNGNTGAGHTTPSEVTPAAPKTTLCPFTVAIDTREQRPFEFTGLRADAYQKYANLVVHSVPASLKQGDYSIIGHEHRIAIERKSAQDLFQTLLAGRKRFVRELERLQSYQYSAVVVEADWASLYDRPPMFVRNEDLRDGEQILRAASVRFKQVYRTVISLEQRFPTRWWFCPDRRFAEVTTFRILERFWKDFQAGMDSKHS